MHSYDDLESPRLRRANGMLGVPNAGVAVRVSQAFDVQAITRVSASTRELDIEPPSAARAAWFDDQRAWVDRCRASIVERDPLLDAADVLDLAITLSGLPRCRGLLPEFAAGLLLADQLGQLQ